MDLQQTLRHVGAESLTPMQQEAYARGLHGEGLQEELAEVLK